MNNPERRGVMDAGCKRYVTLLVLMVLALQLSVVSAQQAAAADQIDPACCENDGTGSPGVGTAAGAPLAWGRAGFCSAIAHQPCCSATP
jgi:hypothetical protein